MRARSRGQGGAPAIGSGKGPSLGRGATGETRRFRPSQAERCSFRVRSPYRRIRKSSWRDALTENWVKLRCREHEVVEEAGECIVGVQREYVSDILVGADNNDTALI